MATLAMSTWLCAQDPPPDGGGDDTFEALQAALGDSVSGADFIVSHAELGDHFQVAVKTSAEAGFPTEGDSYVLLSTGDARFGPEEDSFAGYYAPGVFDPYYHADLYDLGGLAVDVALPPQAASLSVDYTYWSWDYDGYVDPFRIYLETPDGTSRVAQADCVAEFGMKADSLLTVGNLHTLTVDVSAWQGQTVTLRFEVADSFDYSVDSGVLLDNLVVALKSNEPPVADAGLDQQVACTSSAGAAVTLDGTLSTDPDEDDVLTCLWSAPDGVVFDDPTSATPTATFPVGVTNVTLTVSDGTETASDTVDVSVTLTVNDDVPPSVKVSTSVGNLWPPNHRIEAVGVRIQASDDSTAPGACVLQSVTVSSSEPDSSKGHGPFAGDVAGADGFKSPVDITSAFAWNPLTMSFDGDVGLRAERKGKGDGRTYTIMATVTDGSGNATSVSTTVVVSHSQGK
ncbi:MAG TPA: hypothetical protein VFY71_13620, partial [Planctomycetota bacterium]|nr:hypothetical protein [Planctomycetota bacterium]